MNQRRRTRVEAHKHATLAWQDQECRGELRNLSLKGCLLERAEGSTPRPGEAIRIAIHLEPGAGEFDVALQGRVVRVDPEAVAVDFTEIPPESFPHLFRLVQYNASDPDGIEEELGSSAFNPPGQN